MRKHLLSLIIMLSLLLTGCQGASRDVVELRIAVLPILDTLPMYVADVEEYFVRESVAVSFVTAASAAERDQLLQAGQVDGIITDLVALALYNRDAVRVIAVRYAMTPAPDFAQFRLMSSAQSDVTQVADVRGVSIGVSEGTVIEYVTQRMLEAEGVPATDVTLLAVPKISDRLALLNAGELEAATLPEPLASLAQQQGARGLVDDTQHPDYSCSVFAFRKDVLDAHPEAIEGFLSAVDRASADINADKGRWESLLIERKLVPSPLVGAYTLPDYPASPDGSDILIPTETQFNDVLAWLQEAGRMMQEIEYRDVVVAVR